MSIYKYPCCGCERECGECEDRKLNDRRVLIPLNNVTVLPANDRRDDNSKGPREK